MKKIFAHFFSVLLLAGIVTLASCDFFTSSTEEPTYVPKVTYVVTYSSKYGAEPGALTVDANTKLKEENLPELSETGRIFKGWFIGDEKIAADYVVKSNITLVAAWESEKYTITYLANTVEEQTKIEETFDYDTQITVKDNTFTAATGYKFNNWNTKADGSGTTYKKGDKINLVQNVELYANWIEKNSHNIVYVNVNGSDNSNPKIFAEKDSVVLSPLANTEFYTFGGWYFDSALTEKAEGWTTGEYTADVTVYAKWTPVTFKLSFDGNSGEGSMEEITVTYGDIITLPATAYTKAGYSFAGWNTKADGSGLSYGDITSYTATADSKLFAQWKLVTYHIQYVLNGGVLDSENPQNYTVESEEIELNKPSKEGADFTGWHQKADCSDEAFNEIPSGTTGDLILYASYEVSKYTIKLINNGSDVNGSMADFILEYKVYGKIPELTLTRTGYTFVCWNTKADGTGDYSYLNGGQIVTTSDVTLYAIWKINEYSITYNLDGGLNDSENPVIYTFNQGTITLNPATKPGYVFEGWYLVENDEVTDTKITSITASKMIDVEVAAKWVVSTETPYTVRYYLQNFDDDNYVLDSEETLTGTTNEKTAANAKAIEGYNAIPFDQAVILADGSTCVNIYYNLPVIWYGFEGKGFDFDSEKVAVLWISAKSGKVIGDVFEYANPIRSGYAFGGWFDSETNEPLDLSEEMTQQKRFYAKWSYAAKYVTLTNIEDISMTAATNTEKTEITFTLPEGLESYKWYLDDNELAGETENTLTIDTTALVHGGVYTLYVETVENGIPKSAGAEFVVGE